MEEEPEREPVHKKLKSWQAIEKAAQQILDAGADPTKAQAVDLALKRDPMLFVAYARETS